MDLISPLVAGVESALRAETEASPDWAAVRKDQPRLFDPEVFLELLRAGADDLSDSTRGVWRQMLGFLAHIQESAVQQPFFHQAAERLARTPVPTSSRTFFLGEAWLQLTASPDRAEREALTRAIEAQLSSRLQPELRRLDEATDLAKRLEVASYLALHERIQDVKLAEVEAAAARFLERTEDAYQDVMAFLLRRGAGLSRSTSLHDTAWHDLRHLAWTYRPPGTPDTTSMKAALEGWLEPWLRAPFRGKGISFRPLNNAGRALGGARFVGAGIEWHYSANRAAEGVLAAFDAAADLARLRFASADDSIEARALVSSGIAHTYRSLFRQLSFEPIFLRTQLGVPKELAIEAARSFATLQLLELRQAAAEVRFQRDLYGAVDRSELAARGVEQLQQALIVSVPRILGLYDFEPELAGAWTFLGACTAAALRHFALESFDDDYFRNPRLADWLKRRWARGARETVPALAKACGTPLPDSGIPSEQPLIEGLLMALNR